MTKRILVIAGPQIPVPPLLYGGTERIVSIVIDGLVDHGYMVDLMAAPLSKKKNGDIFYYQDGGLNIVNRVYQRIKFYYGSLKLGIRADVVINNGRLDYLMVILLLRKKVVTIFHNPITNFDISTLLKHNTSIVPVCISFDQITNCGSNINFKLIYNCGDSQGLRYNQYSKRTYFVFIGRLTKNKGIDKAIEFAIRAKKKLKVAGPIPNSNENEITFFNSCVLPYFENEFVEYVGEVSDISKNALFENAIASIFPICWKEPFGLTLVESLLCGVPVIAANKASFPELMEHGNTGFLCTTDEEYLDAIIKVGLLSNSYCRDYALKKFGRDRMVSEYVNLISSF